MTVKRFVKGLSVALLLCVMLPGNADAQDLKSVLSGVLKTVVGDKVTTETSIIGTWTYVAPDCQFESSNLLAKAGGEAAAERVEEKLSKVFDTFGINGIQYTFKDDKTYSYTLKGKTMTGTYVFDKDEKTITMTGKLGMKIVAHVMTTGNNMSFLFNADKLLSVVKVISGSVSSASALSNIAGTYDGMLLGFELKK